MADHRPRTLGEVEQMVAPMGVQFPHLVQAVLVLSAIGAMTPVQDDAAQQATRERSDRLNAALLRAARSSSDIGYLASPATGGGVGVTRFQQLFLLARREGYPTPREWAQFAWHWVAAQDQRLIKDGRTLELAEENLEELERMATEFAEKGLPPLQALGVA
jgi:hypothetical protein